MAFFGQRKPNKFNFKPVYLKDEDETGISDKMHDKWNRVPNAQLLSQGKRNIIKAIVLIVAIVYLSYKIYDYFIQSL
jgi:hypothetical protein